MSPDANAPRNGERGPVSARARSQGGGARTVKYRTYGTVNVCVLGYVMACVMFYVDI